MNSFSLPVYKADVIMFFNKSEFEKHHEKHIGAVSLNGVGAVAYYHEDNYLKIMLGVFNNNTANLAHEIVHVCSAVFLTHGILYDTENDEPYAYLFEHIFLEANEMLYRYYGVVEGKEE